MRSGGKKSLVPSSLQSASQAEFASSKLRTFDSRPDLSESDFSIRGSVIGKGRESTIVGGSELRNGQDGSRFKNPIAYLLRRLDGRSNRVETHRIRSATWKR